MVRLQRRIFAQIHNILKQIFKTLCVNQNTVLVIVSHSKTVLVFKLLKYTRKGQYTVYALSPVRVQWVLRRWRGLKGWASQGRLPRAQDGSLDPRAGSHLADKKRRTFVGRLSGAGKGRPCLWEICLGQKVGVGK